MEDLKPSELETGLKDKSSGSQKDVEKSLNQLYEYAIKKATEAIDWYYFKRKPKRRYGLLLRYCSIFLIALAGILPILITIFKNCNINPAWSAVVVGLAGLMLAIDKFGGFTSGWIRYVMAAQKLNQIMEEFRFTWESNKVRPMDTPLNTDEIQTLIKNCQEFLQNVQLIVSDETQKWVVEFQSALNDIDEAAKIAAESAKANVKTKEEGAIAITVSNGVSCEKPWSITLNGKFVSNYSGNSAALSNLKPGIVILKITGTINGKHVEDEKPVSVKGGEISSITMTLA